MDNNNIFFCNDVRAGTNRLFCAQDLCPAVVEPMSHLATTCSKTIIIRHRYDMDTTDTYKIV